jgi:hypothetical protein
MLAEKLLLMAGVAISAPFRRGTPVASWLQPSPRNVGDSEQRSTNSSQGRLRPPLIV